MPGFTDENVNHIEPNPNRIDPEALEQDFIAAQALALAEQLVARANTPTSLGRRLCLCLLSLRETFQGKLRQCFAFFTPRAPAEEANPAAAHLLDERGPE